MSIRAAIVGPTGYSGLYLIELLLRHPGAQITYLATRRDQQPDITDEFAQLADRVPADVARCRPIDPQAMGHQADVAFICLPSPAAMQLVPALLDAGLRVIDLSGDYRLDDVATYERAYEHKHIDPANLAAAKYGLPELFRDDLRGATLICCPGCFATAVALGIAPLLTRAIAQPTGIIANAATGVSGAGRAAKAATHFPELNESFYAYKKIGGHQHQPEMVQVLSRVVGADVDLLFVPHLLPIDRGILATIYLDAAQPDVTEQQVIQALHDAYDREPFVRVREHLPNVKHVRDTNFCDVTARVVPMANATKIVVFSAIDNMIKGASGQMVQNMNLMFALEETAGVW